MLQVALIDPALGRTGAHNRGFAHLLANSRDECGEIGIWCNTAIESSVYEELASCGVSVEPVFDLDFYRILQKQGGGVSDHWEWIYALARQYELAFEQVQRRWPRGTICVVHHTLSWEHASALALALKLAGGAANRLQHLALLMFSPGMDEAGHIHDLDAVSNYRLAFRSLWETPAVSLFASCSEYSRAYAKLLELPAALPVHPCFLDVWDKRPVNANPRPHNRLLLYAGEIKQEKGFLRLPLLLDEALRKTSEETEIVLQFVAVRNQAARNVVQELEAIASSHARVRIHVGFWTEQQLREMLRSTDVLCLNYDATAYRHATSGLLWLAAWYGVAVMVPAETWLRREAIRLGVPVWTDFDVKPTKESGKNASHHDYFKTLFTSFPKWLRQLASSLPGATDSVQSAHGADIVVFWKQNDTGLYGRRSDMVVRYLASRSDVRKVLVVDAAIGDANLERLSQSTPTPTHNQRIYDEIQRKLRGDQDTGKVSFHVYVCPLTKFRFRDDGTDRPHFIDGYHEYLARVFESAGVDPSRAVFWVYPTNFHLPDLIDRFKPTRVVVDVEDDQRAWPNVSATRRARLTENYRSLLGMADMALTNCEPLRRSMSPMFPDIRLVPNGCDPDPPRSTPRNNEAFNEFIQFAGMTIGFVGNLESKIDMELLEKVAERFVDCQIVLLGSTHANPGVYTLSRHPNVRMPGIVPYDELDAWVRKFDVGLVPHLHNELTKFMNPQKIYAYLSSHVPVVSTSVPNIPSDTDLVRIAPNHDAFLREIASVLASERPSASAFNEYIRINSWQSRLSDCVDALNLVAAGAVQTSRVAPPRAGGSLSCSV